MGTTIFLKKTPVKSAQSRLQRPSVRRDGDRARRV
jgi:hypothetical protein